MAIKATIVYCCDRTTEKATCSNSHFDVKSYFPKYSNFILLKQGKD